MTTTTERTYRVRDGREQVRHLLPAFREALTNLEGYRYNDSFRGRIEGMDAATDEDEGTAIYLLQTLERDTRRDELVAEHLADGWLEVDVEDGVMEPHSRVPYAAIVVATASDWNRYDGSRLVADVRGRPYAVLPKGRRTNGKAIVNYSGHDPARVIVLPKGARA